MMQRFLELRPAVTLFLANTGGDFIDQLEWSFMKAAVDALKPLYVR